MRKLFLGLKIDSSYASLAFSSSLGNLERDVKLRLIERKEGNSEELDFDILEKIKEEISEIEKATSSKVSKIYFCFPQPKVRKIKASYKKLIHPKHSLPLTISSLTSSLKEAELLNLDWEDFCLEAYPLEFRLDGKVFRNPPLGIYGRRLEIDVLFYVARRTELLSLEKVFQYLERPYEELILSSLAEVSSLKEDALPKNFSLLNIGKNKLEFSYFRNFILEDSFSIYKGGKFIDDRVSQELGVSSELSEEIKLSYGSLAQADLEDSRVITVKKVSRYREIKRATLNSILLSCYQKILEELRDILERKDILRKIESLIIIGGASKIKGFSELAKRILSLPVNPPCFYSSLVGKDPDKFCASLGALKYPFSDFNIKNKYIQNKGLLSKIRNFLEEYF